jgi:hypothetical protein
VLPTILFKTGFLVINEDVDMLMPDASTFAILWPTIPVKILNSPTSFLCHSASRVFASLFCIYIVAENPSKQT